MELKVLSERYNPLLGREEIQVEIVHPGQGTPTRASAKEFLASKLKLDKGLLVIRRMATKTGLNRTLCEVEVYRDAELMRRVFPKHIIERETPKGEQKGQGD
ncbi:MAG: 30S ribosomal protein S24e [Candidatus Bathyarchaeia archaeon]